MANTDRARKLLVRTALVTSTTIATLIGAQNFAMLDARNFQTEATPSNEPNEVVVVTPVATRTPVPVERAAPDITIMNVAPSITILRQSGQANAVQPVAAANVTSIQPPAPAQIEAPSPVVVQQPIPQRSQSSR